MRDNTVTVFDLESGAIIRVSSNYGEIARALAIYDAQLANGKMTQKEHSTRVRVLSSMLDKTSEYTATETQVTRRADKVRASRDYDGYWSDDMVGAFTSHL